MRLKHLLTLFLFPLIGSVQAETVYIENYFLAKKLEEIVPGCIEDRELDTECEDLTSISTLVLNDDVLIDIQDEIFEKHTNNLYGLEFLTGLNSLTLQINKLDLEVSGSELPGQLQELSIRSNNLENIDIFDDLLEVNIDGLPASVKKISIDGGRDAMYYFGVNATNLPNSVEEIVASCFYLHLGTLPGSIRKLTLSNGSELNTINLNEGLTELNIFDLRYFYEEGNSEPLLPRFPSTLKKLTFDGLYLTDLDYSPLDENFYRSNFVFNEGLETLIIRNAEWFNKVNFPSSLKHLEYFQTMGSLIGEMPNGLETLKYNDNYYYSGTFAFPASLRHIELKNSGLKDYPAFNNGLLTLDISMNQYSSFPALPATLEELIATDCGFFIDNPDHISLPANLKVLNLSGNIDVECLPILPRTLETLNIEYTNVTCIPNETDYIYHSTELPLCTNTCGASIGNDIFTGRVFLNLVGGWQFDEGDVPVAGAIIQTSKGNYVTDSEGRYSVTVEPFEIVQYKIEYYHPLLNKTFYADNVIVKGKFEHYGIGEVYEVDFPIHLINANDLEVAGSNNKAKPGFDNTARFTVTNFGATTENNVRLSVQKPADWTYQSSDPVATTITADSIIWENISLIPLQSRTFATTSTLPATSNILGDLYTFTAKVTPVDGDVYPANNLFVLSDTIRGAYDPNDKQVYPSQILPEYSSTEKFIYTIRFQNTGNDTATFVYILDTIQAGLIANSIDIIDSSHAMTWAPLENGVIRFDFQNIQLPDSTTNSLGSQGFVTFSLVPEAGLPQGTVFENKAAIYFDFNEPIITNTATVEVIVPTGIRQGNRFTSKMYPNPAKNTTRVEWSESGKAYISLIDISGRVVYQSTTLNQYQDISLSRVNAGMYFVKIDIGNSSSINKLIVE